MTTRTPKAEVVAARPGPGWGVNLGGRRWHRIDKTKPPAGQVSFCGVGIITLENLRNAPYYTGTGELHDILTGAKDAPVCRKCEREP